MDWTSVVEIAKQLRAAHPRDEDTYLIPRLEQWGVCRNAIIVACLNRDPSFDVGAFKMLSEGDTRGKRMLKRVYAGRRP